MGKARLHHLALFARDVGSVAAFYRDLFEIPEVRRNAHEDGIRSVWLQVGEVILMVERPRATTVHGEPALGAGVMVFAGEPGSYAMWAERLAAAGAGPTDRTDFTVYGRDPEGNRFGVSSWPEGLG